MISREQYYTAPEQAVFDDIKDNAIKIWQTYDNEYGYVDEKVNRIKGIQNIRDNAWYIVCMFDHLNQAKLLSMVNDTTREVLSSVLAGVE